MLQVFEQQKVRTVWDDETQKWYFAIVDVVGVLTQSIPSPKAEPFKQWMANVATKRIEQINDPELSIEQAKEDYRRKGYSERWISQRMKGIEARNELTEEWSRRGVQEKQYGILTDEITRTWSGKTTGQYKKFKRLDARKKENLRDNKRPATTSLY